MPKKRKNGGKNRHNRGLVGFVRCDVSGRAVPKDKAIKRFIVRNLVDASGKKDLESQSVYNEYPIPKMYYKAYYSISAAIHQRIVRPRNKNERKKRAPPADVQKKWAQQASRELMQQAEELERKQGGGDAGGTYNQGFSRRGARGGRGGRGGRGDGGRGRGFDTSGTHRGGRGGGRGTGRGRGEPRTRGEGRGRGGRRARGDRGGRFRGQGRGTTDSFEATTNQ